MVADGEIVTSFNNFLKFTYQEKLYLIKSKNVHG